MSKPWYSIFYMKSPVTKILVGTATLLITLAALIFQTVLEEPRMAAQTGNWSGRSVEKGAELYAANCVRCHGPEGKGGANLAPPLNSKHFFEQRIKDVGFLGSPYNYVKLTIAGGRPVKSRPEWAENMPTWGNRFGGPLRDDQVEYLTDFVMNWQSTAISQTAETDPWNTVIVPMDQAAAALAGAPTGPLPPQMLFVVMGCGACHVLDPNSTAKMNGPNLGQLPELAATRNPPMTAEQYVYESIVNPSDFIVEGFGTVPMLANFTERMSEEEINSLVTWLLNPDRIMQ